jgi:hypothetical protein
MIIHRNSFKSLSFSLGDTKIFLCVRKGLYRVLRGIFRPKRDEVTGEWKKLHNEELNDLYCSPNIMRVIKWRM